MATKKKDTVKATKAVKGEPRLNSDGTPWTPPPRRPAAEILVELQEKRANVLEKHKKELATLDKKIAYHQQRREVDPAEAEATAKELLGEGMTPEQIDALIARLQTGKKALKDKTPEEIALLQAEALAGKQAAEDAAPAVPSWVAPVVVG